MANRDDAKTERFRIVYDDCFTKVCDFARRRVPDHEVDDVVSATFLVVWRRLNSVPAENALPWVYRVAGNVVSDRYRSRRRWQRLLLRIGRTRPAICVDAEWCPDEEVIAALNRLPPGDRTVLVLRYWEELKPVEIAGILGVSVNAVTIRLHRARNRLGSLLESSNDDGQSSGSGGGRR